ncbi:E3 ubiquitin-protein ligase TRIM11-like [Trichosurus vulpecula]|uniref:E3 ubiquitin-protein ligase TRIM11-like n=1 Tax=Trichosurus vulpecula TaxID=9337 RepID=UPI00186B54B3|nr:E3 ubiquitin-protein ligase TRIM11-like [Trichosurus vulpecula]
MASYSEQIQDFQRELTCSICMEFFTNPVSTECGHTFCYDCFLRSCQEVSPPIFCPECRSVIQMRDFKTNIRLGKLATIAQKLRSHPSPYFEGRRKCEVHQKVQKLFCEDDHRPICVSCSQSQEHKAHRLRCIDEAAEDFRERLRETVTVLWRKTEDVVQLMANEKFKFAQDMEEVLNRNEYVLQKEIETFGVHVTTHIIPGMMERIFNLKVDITLDRNTADSGLIISEDLKSVRYGGVQEEAPNNSGRLPDFAQVLGTQSFISGRYYWEVEVPNNTLWCVGICPESKESQDFFVLRTVKTHNYFFLYAMAQHNLYSKVHTKYRQVNVPNLKVGIFLDYERGEISFYHVKNRYLIYTFPATSFSGPLMPLFCLPKKISTDDCSLTICP